MYLYKHSLASSQMYRKTSPSPAPDALYRVLFYLRTILLIICTILAHCIKKAKHKLSTAQKKALLLQSLLLMLLTCSLTLLYKRRCLARHGIFVHHVRFELVLIQVSNLFYNYGANIGIRTLA